jgi:hypothetical protein
VGQSQFCATLSKRVTAANFRDAKSVALVRVVPGWVGGRSLVPGGVQGDPPGGIKSLFSIPQAGINTYVQSEPRSFGAIADLVPVFAIAAFRSFYAFRLSPNRFRHFFIIR